MSGGGNCVWIAGETEGGEVGKIRKEELGEKKVGEVG